MTQAIILHPTEMRRRIFDESDGVRRDYIESLLAPQHIEAQDVADAAQAMRHYIDNYMPFRAWTHTVVRAIRSIW